MLLAVSHDVSTFFEHLTLMCRSVEVTLKAVHAVNESNESNESKDRNDSHDENNFAAKYSRKVSMLPRPLKPGGFIARQYARLSTLMEPALGSICVFLGSFFEHISFVLQIDIFNEALNEVNESYPHDNLPYIIALHALRGYISIPAYTTFRYSTGGFLWRFEVDELVVVDLFRVLGGASMLPYTTTNRIRVE
jgi:hypothetical protein